MMGHVAYPTLQTIPVKLRLLRKQRDEVKLKKNPKKKISEIRVSKLVRHYTTIEGMHSSPRTQTPTTEPPGAPDHYRCRNRQASIDRKGETRRPTYIDKTAWRQHTYINTVSAYYLFWLR